MNRVPRYHQIARSLRERIAAGTPAPGERLDNQRSLAREFEVTLMTLRQALELLERWITELWIFGAVDNIGDRAVRDAVSFPQPGRSATFGIEGRW